MPRLLCNCPILPPTHLASLLPLKLPKEGAWRLLLCLLLLILLFLFQAVIAVGGRVIIIVAQAEDER